MGVGEWISQAFKIVFHFQVLHTEFLALQLYNTLSIAGLKFAT